LRALAHLHGVQLSYRGADGRPRRAADDAVVAVLAALGAPVRSRADALGALREARARLWARTIEPVLVHRPGRACRPDVRLPPALSPMDVWVTLVEEDGTRQARRLAHCHHRHLGVRGAEGATRSVHRFSIEPGTAGYHRLLLEGPGIEANSLLVSAPLRCPQPPRSWGTFLPLHALRTERDWGVGSYRELAELGEWLRDRGGAFHGVLPLFATTATDAGGSSPYLPSSRLAFEDAFVDIEALPELRNEDRWAGMARDALGSPALRQELRALRGARHADLQAVAARKAPLMELLAWSLAESGGPRRQAFEAFREAHPALEAFARFHAGHARTGGRREAGHHDPPSRAAVPDVTARARLYGQWAASEQLAPMRDLLYLDLPVGVDPEGFDVHTEPDLFVGSVTVGAPPDPFFAAGQNWGFPPLHPEAIRLQGYRHVAAVVRHAMTHAAMVRIDHVMGLHRLFWVPQGTDPRSGVYVRYRADELHAIVVLEASRAGTVVVGEDLGTVPETVRRAMARDGMLSSYVMQFRSTPDDPLPTPPPDALVSFGTHDLPTFASFWRGAGARGDGDTSDGDADTGHADEDDTDEDDTDEGDTGNDESATRPAWRAAVADALDVAPQQPDQVLRRWLAELGASPASVVMVDLEDLWLEPVSQNRPGTTDKNFTRRAARTLGELAGDAEVLAALRTLQDVRGTPEPAAHDDSDHEERP
jgi:4-alpha-glucanotransferase